MFGSNPVGFRKKQSENTEINTLLTQVGMLYFDPETKIGMTKNLTTTKTTL